MEPYQNRVIEEKNQLDEKIERLHVFIISDQFDSVGSEERQRLIGQRKAMIEYSQILQSRIEHF